VFTDPAANQRFRIGTVERLALYGSFELREAFADRKLDRLTKEVLAFAASMTDKSDYGVDPHLR
jgi:hypothetical protein